MRIENALFLPQDLAIRILGDVHFILHLPMFSLRILFVKSSAFFTKLPLDNAVDSVTI